MNQPNPTHHKTRWFGQYALYLVLFALLVSAGAYFLLGGEEPARPQPATPPTPTPTQVPAGQSGHDAPR